MTVSNTEEPDQSRDFRISTVKTLELIVEERRAVIPDEGLVEYNTLSQLKKLVPPVIQKVVDNSDPEDDCVEDPRKGDHEEKHIVVTEIAPDSRNDKENTLPCGAEATVDVIQLEIPLPESQLLKERQTQTISYRGIPKLFRVDAIVGTKEFVEPEPRNLAAPQDGLLDYLSEPGKACENETVSQRDHEIQEVLSAPAELKQAGNRSDGGGEKIRKKGIRSGSRKRGGN